LDFVTVRVRIKPEEKIGVSIRRRIRRRHILKSRQFLELERKRERLLR
jgi:hypothetical protein